MRRIFYTVVLCCSILILSPSIIKGQQISLSTNFADYAFLGTFNLTAGYSLSRNYTVQSTVKYNPFHYGNGENRKEFKRLSLSGGGRFWPWFVNSGWFVSGALEYGIFRYGGLFTDKSYQGRAFGANVGGGYALMLAQNLNLEVGLSAFVGGIRYRRYSCVVCGVEEIEKTKVAVSPSDVLLSVAFIF